MEASKSFVPLHRNQVIITMVCVMFAMFLAALDQTIVSTATPQIIADLGGFDRYTLISTGYLLASTVSAPIVGSLSDTYGRKRFFLGAIIIFVIGSTLCGLSSGINQLVLFRVFQGLGGGVIMAITFISIADLFPPSDRGKYMGLVAACYGLSSVIGPTLGGYITDSLSWHWIFFVNIPLSIPVLLLLYRYFPQKSIASDEINNANGPADWKGMALLIVGITFIVVGLSMVESQSTKFLFAGGGITFAGIVLMCVFVQVERDANNPILPLSIFRIRMVSVSLLLTLLTGFAMFGAIIFVPLYFQGVLGLSATNSGTFLTPMMLGVVVGAGISGQILSRTGGQFRLQFILGVTIMSIGTFLFVMLDETSSYVMSIAFIVLLGFGLGSTFPTLTVSVQNFTPPTLIGAATSLTQFARSVGGLLGLSVLGMVLTHRFSTRFEDKISGTNLPMGEGVIENIKNDPKVLVDSESQNIITELASGLSFEQVEELLNLLKKVLNGAIGDVFIVTLVVLILSLGISVALNQKGFVR